MEIENLRFVRVIAHEAPKLTPENDSATPGQSEVLLDFDEEGEAEVRKRLTNALGKNSHSVELTIDDATEGSVFDSCTRLLDADDAKFVEISQGLATKLIHVQSGVGSARSGLVVIIEAKVSQSESARRAVLVVKADGESAFLKEGGSARVSLRLVKELFLGPQQKLYKIGIFVEMADGEAPRDPSDFAAHVFDHLMSQTADRNAAAYFYQGFLGCKLAESAIKRTRQFFELTTEFIKGLKKLEPTERVDLKNNLIVYLKSEKPQISISGFADEFLRQEHHAEYKKFMRSKKFPQSSVSKDTGAIKNKLRIRNITFTSNVKISAPADEFASLVKIGEKKDGWTSVMIRGDLDEV